MDAVNRVTKTRLDSTGNGDASTEGGANASKRGGK